VLIGIVIKYGKSEPIENRLLVTCWPCHFPRHFVNDTFVQRHVLSLRHFVRYILSGDILQGHLWVYYWGPWLQINSLCYPRFEKVGQHWLPSHNVGRSATQCEFGSVRFHKVYM